MEPLNNATVGNPIMVKNVFKQPSYWLITLLKKDRLAGLDRVLLIEKIAHLGTFYSPTSHLHYNHAFVTGVESSEADKLTAKVIRKDIGESASEPVFVHDGPIGKEAWLIEVSINGKPNRWIFVTGQGIYECRVVQTLDNMMEQLLFNSNKYWNIDKCYFSLSITYHFYTIANSCLRLISSLNTFSSIL